MSPASTWCSMRTCAAVVDHPDGARRRGSRRSCRASRTPRPCWAMRPTLGTDAHGGRVEGAVGLAVVDDGLRRRRRSSSRGSRPGVSCCSPSAFHIWPDVRIIAGMEASTMTSLGTCRLVMPRSESTMARGGAGGDRAWRCRPRSRPLGRRGARRSGPPGRPTRRWGRRRVRSKVVGVPVEHLGEVRHDGVAEDDRVGDLHHGGLEVQREQHARAPGVVDLLGEERRRGPARS